MPDRCPICDGDLWTCAVHRLTPMSRCDCPADGIPCRCNPTDKLPPDFMTRWSREQSTPAPTLQ